MPDGTLLLALRWLHFVAGITWIGLLYFFNLVNVRFAASIDASVRPTVIPPLLSRALAWFRHSAWVTVLVGLIMAYQIYWQDGFLNTNPDKTISTGGLLGLIMLFNVWFIIWPNQKKIIEAMRAGQPPNPMWGRNALWASRTNFSLSFPMLLFMAGASHFAMDWDGILIWGIILGIIGFLVVYTVQKWAAARF